MTKEQWEQLVTKAADAGIILEVQKVSEERETEVRRYFRENPPVDYLSLMK